MSRKPTTTKAAATKPADDKKQEPVTKLAQVPDPAKLTDGKIDEIAGEHSDPSDPEQTANVDAAENLEKTRDDAKMPEIDEPRGYFHGQGGAAGL